MRRAALFICSILLLLVSPLARGQGINISLVGKHKPSQSGFGDVWGDGNIACMGVWLSSGYNNGWGTGIYDISNPGSPKLLTTYNYGSGVGNRFEQGVIRSNILYLGSWGGSGNGDGSGSGSGLHIISLANPSSPVLLSRITKRSVGTVTNGFDDVHTLWVERNFLYEAAHNPGVVSVKVFDVSNPSAPVYLRDIVTTNTTKVHQMTVGMKGSDIILYTSGWGGADNGNSSSYGQTDIWKVNNIGTQPAQWLGRLYSGYNSHSSWPTPDGNTLVVCRETPGGEVSFYDISTPPKPTPNAVTNPAPIAVISPARMGIEGDIPHNPVIISNLLFLSWYQNGLQIFDISDRTKPVRIGAYDTYPSASSSSYQGNWGIYPKLGLNKILVSDINNGFFILDASAVLTNTNNYPPLLVQHPSNVTADFGTTATISSVVTGSSLKYQWRFNNAILPGATNSSIVFNSVQASDSGNYYVVASNSLGAVTSGVAALTVNIPQGAMPSITGQPQDVSVYAGSSATLSVAVTGAAPINYQWRLNGADIPGATTSSFALDSVQPENVGNYSVYISNAYGSVTSSNALLSIIDSPYLNSVQAFPGSRGALISWNSTVPSDSHVQFEVANAVIAMPDGAAAQGASFGNSSYIDRTMTTNHTILLTGLEPATRYSFQVISSADTNSFVSGVYQFTTAGAPIILDNTNSEVTFVGNWNTSVNVSGYYGSNYRYSSANANAASNAIFRPNVPIPGKYDVSVWYPAASDRSQNAPFTISYQGGWNTYSVNQRVNGGQWNLLASSVPFAAGSSGYVQLGNNASASVVIADAVKFAYVDAQDTPSDNSIPAWWENFYGVSDPAADSDDDGFSDAEEYLLGTSPVDANSRFTLEAQAAGNSANITFWPYIGNRAYELLYKSNISDATWQVLTPANIIPTAYGHGIFNISTANTPHGFYRVGVRASAQGDFSGAMPIPQADRKNGFAEAACGVNRVYIAPR